MLCVRHMAIHCTLAYGWLIHSLCPLCDSFHALRHCLGGSAYWICWLKLQGDLKVISNTLNQCTGKTQFKILLT